MDAVISGQAGTIAFIEGAEVNARRIGSDVEIGLAREGLGYIFESCTDAIYHKGINEAGGVNLLEAAWEADRALRLFLMLIDPDEEDELRSEAVSVLDGMLANEVTRQFIETQIFAHPLPDEAEIDFVFDADQLPSVANFVRRIVSAQPAISRQRKAWNDIGDEYFEKISKEQFEEAAIARGAFRSLVAADLDAVDPNIAIYKCYEVLAAVPNSRAIVSRWTNSFKRPGFKILSHDLDFEEDHVFNDGDAAPSYATYKKVIHQQNAIVDKLRAGSVRVARKYAEELIQSQLAQNGAHYAAKSLCALAQEAKVLGLYSAQLEWSLRAVDINPYDSWAHGQAADALLEFSRLDEALEEFRLCELYGDPEFAATGRARILRYQGRLREALAEFRSVQKRFEKSEAASFAWSGSAETLRDMWRLDDALSEYENALKKFPGRVMLLCGRAAVLADLGRVDEALAAYSVPECKSDLVALNGKAAVLKDCGRLDEALRIADQVIENFPTDSVARCNKADILRIKGDLQGALQVYANVKSKYPSMSVAYSGYAEVLRDMRRLPESVVEYETAAAKFPFNSRILNGCANILKVSDDLGRSLALYENNVRTFPFDLIAKAGRADLLKRLGRYDDALDAYAAILDVWPAFASARNGRAAILAAQNKFEEASALLPDNVLQSRDDWISLHIRGMISLRKGDLTEAIMVFEQGARDVPFIRERRIFNRALGLAEMRRGDYIAALSTLDAAGGGVANVLRFHAYAGGGFLDKARSAYVELSDKCPSQIVELKEVIAGRYGLIVPAPHHNDNWIFEKEAEALLREAA